MVTLLPKLSYVPVREEVTGNPSPSVTRPPDRLCCPVSRPPELVEQGTLPPCADRSGAWTSDDRDERALAARLCRPCPILTECGAAADSTKERFGVWAGVDRTQPTSNKRKGAA